MTKQLKRDGAYGTDINAYSEAGDKGKQAFMRDAAALLKATGQVLTQNHDVPGFRLCKNPGGIAGSGDVYAHYWKLDQPTHQTYVHISSCPVGRWRQDALTIMIRTEEVVNKRTTQMGNNIWLDPNLNSDQLAEEILKHKAWTSTCRE